MKIIMTMMINNLEHSIRVANLSFRLATLLNLSKDNIKSVYKSALFHDLGKADVNPEILNKPTQLTEEEFDHIKKHSIYSYKIALDFGLNILEALNVLHHHENFDGSGYPTGIAGYQIPIGARIIRICDIFDALTSDRVYKGKLDKVSAIEIMIHERENFDERIFHIFLENMIKRS